MKLLADYISRSIREFLVADRTGDRYLMLFCKALYAYALLKVLFSWDVIRTIQLYEPFKFSTVWSYTFYSPLALADVNLDLFLVVASIMLIVAVAAKPNYITAALAFWSWKCVMRLSIQVASGADLVFSLLLFLAIFVPTKPVFTDLKKRSAQGIISNAAILVSQVQMALIYLLSGYEKLISPEWRSGDAMHSVLELEFYTWPSLQLYSGEALNLFLSWFTIVFEIGFALLIWFRWPRKILLITGLIFHVCIGVFLTLPDFAIVMLIGYLPFMVGKGR